MASSSRYSIFRLYLRRLRHGKLGNVPSLVDPGSAQVIVPGLWPGIPPAVSRNPDAGVEPANGSRE
jgi:hypothetical protein